MSFSLTSDTIEPGASVPADHTCDGADRSPALRWTDPPAGTKSFALVMDDPDAPGGLFVHWVLWNLGPDVRELRAGVPPEATVLGGTRQGKTDFGRVGWGGPCPPKGQTHRYRFHLYALDTVPELPPGSATTAASLRKAIEGHVLGTTTLEGRYARPTR